MKTAVIFDNCEGNLSFYVLNGDYLHLDGVYLNSCDQEDLHDDVSRMFYDEETGKELQKHVSKEDFEQAIREGSRLIVVGMLP